MKTRKFLLGIFALIAMLTVMSCEKEKTGIDESDFGILPEKFKVDIPNSISSSEVRSAPVKSASLKSAQGDTIQGDEIYENLNFFIAVGEGAADIVEAIIWSIKVHKIENVVNLTYTSDEDGRLKNLEVLSDVEYDGKTWEFMLTITDAESEVNDDGGKAMQVFWNNVPIEGIAILKPYNINRNDNDVQGALFKIEYSATGMGDYEEYMIVEIDDLPLPDANVEPFGLEAMKMFVGKNGNIVDVYGNSNHPNAKFFTGEKGFNWAFVASGYEEEDIAVVELGLPPSDLDATSRKLLLEDYSVKNVISNEVNEWVFDQWGVYPTEEMLAGYLKNTEAPGYFDNTGFLRGGTAPSDEYSELEGRIEELAPYNPSDIGSLDINFK